MFEGSGVFMKHIHNKKQRKPGTRNGDAWRDLFLKVKAVPGLLKQMIK